MKTFIIALTASMSLLTGCSNSTKQPEPADTDAMPVSEIYDLGAERADRMIVLCGTDTVRIQSYLLDLHVSACSLETLYGKEAFSIYRQGFRERLTERAPETADLIF